MQTLRNKKNVLASHLCINIRTQLLRIVVVQSHHPLHGHIGINIPPPISVLPTFNFHDHVMGHVSSPSSALSPVEPIGVFVAPNFDRVPFGKGQFLITSVWVGGHSWRVVIEKSDEPARPLLGRGGIVRVLRVGRSCHTTPCALDLRIASDVSTSSRILLAWKKWGEYKWWGDENQRVGVKNYNISKWDYYDV